MCQTTITGLLHSRSVFVCGFEGELIIRGGAEDVSLSGSVVFMRGVYVCALFWSG